MAEALLRHHGTKQIEAFSAGSQPAGFIHPLAIQAMQALGVPLDNQQSKSWDEFADVPIDVVITLCDSAAAEVCPNWQNSPIRAHWSMPDPAYHMGSDADRVELAMRVAKRLEQKIKGLLSIDWSEDAQPIADRLRFLGEI